jgi:hypothetical protein
MNDRSIPVADLPPHDPHQVVIVTGADARYFQYARELIESIGACRASPVTIGFFDFGVTEDQHDWLTARGIHVKTPETGLVLGSSAEAWKSKMGYLARPFLRENFPGYSVYIWLDADVWLQSWDGIGALLDGAIQTGAAMVRQNERAYRFWPWLLGWQLKHFVLGYGAVKGAWLASRPHINNGVFAMRADAPHWARWRDRYQKAFDRTRLAAPHDQFGLNAAVYLDRLPVCFLPATCNWICDLAVPMWNSEAAMFCAPYPPHTPIAHLHLAGPAKTNSFDVKATDGSSRHGPLRFANLAEAVSTP